MSKDFKEFQRKVANRKFAIDNSWRGESKSFEEPVATRPVGGWYMPKKLPWEQLNENLQEADACKYFDGYINIVSHKKWVLFLKKAIRKLLKISMGWYIFPQYQRLSHFHGKIVNTVNLQRDILVTAIEQNQRIADKVGEQERVFNARMEEEKEAMLAMLGQLQTQVNALAWKNEQLKLKLKKVEALPAKDDSHHDFEDDFYHDFEEKFRGSMDDIRNRLSVYVPKIKKHLPDWSCATFVDVGSGRGEWLDILRANGATNYVGVDLNARQNSLCTERGHRVLQMDFLEYLASLPENSMDLITGFQVIEHLCLSDLIVLLKESYRVLKQGGMILFETQNPRNLIVGADTFYIDPSHKRPIEPRMIAFFVEWCGYQQIECIDVNINPLANKFELSDEVHSKDFVKFIDEYNDIKWLLYGPQDYAVFGVKE